MIRHQFIVQHCELLQNLIPHQEQGQLDRQLKNEQKQPFVQNRNFIIQGN